MSNKSKHVFINKILMFSICSFAVSLLMTAPLSVFGYYTYTGSDSGSNNSSSYYDNTSDYTSSYYDNTNDYTSSYYDNTSDYTSSYYDNTSDYTSSYYDNTSDYTSSYYDNTSDDWLSCGFVGCGTTYTYTYNPPVHTCTSQCSVVGQRSCSGSGYKSCYKAGDGCLYWSSVTNCGAGQTCNNGSCIVTCSNECSVSGQRSCSGNGYKQCGQYDSDSCLEWSTVTNCGANETCNNGSCISTCSDECTVSGRRECSGNGFRQCGNYDSDSCMEWGTVTNCSTNETCNNGSCISTCQNSCVSGEHQCSGTSGKTCGIFNGSCTSWGNLQSCDSRCYRCGDGRCDSGCGETKSSCPQDCGSINICSDTLSGSPTSEEQRLCANANGQMQCGNGWCKCNCAQQPTVDLRSSGSVECNKSATLTWTSTNATSCVASGQWSGNKSTSGSETVGNFTGSKTFTLSCTSAAGSASDSVTLTGSSDDLTANAGSDKDVDEGESIRLEGSANGNHDEVSWSCTGGTLSNRDTLRPTFKAPTTNYDEERTYTCTMTARNECGSDTDSMKVTVNQKTSNFKVALIARPKTDCAPLNDVDLVATLSNYGNNDYDYTYYFDCTDDGDWEKTVTTDATTYTAANLCDYRNVGSYTAKVKVTSRGRTVTDTEIVRATECERIIEKIGQVSITKNVRNANGSTAYQGTISANPGDTVSYKIVVTGTGEVDNVYISDAMPGNITNVRDLQIDGTSRGGSLVSGMNIGSLYDGQTRIITYNATVANAGSFGYGQTTLTNTATVTVDGASANSSAAVQVYRQGAVQGATTVSTGFDSNAYAGMGIALAAMVLCAGYLAYQVIGKKKTAEEILASKIAWIRKNG